MQRNDRQLIEDWPRLGGTANVVIMIMARQQRVVGTLTIPTAIGGARLAVDRCHGCPAKEVHVSDPPDTERPYQIDDEWSQAVFTRRTGKVGAFLTPHL